MLFPHRQKVLVVQQAHNLLGPLLVNRKPRVLMFGHGLHYLLERRVHRNRDDVIARHHDFAHVDVVQIEHTVNDVLLHLGQVAQTAARADDEFQFLG